MDAFHSDFFVFLLSHFFFETKKESDWDYGIICEIFFFNSIFTNFYIYQYSNSKDLKIDISNSKFESNEIISISNFLNFNSKQIKKENEKKNIYNIKLNRGFQFYLIRRNSTYLF